MDNHIHTELIPKIPLFGNPFIAFVFGSERSGKNTMILSAIDHLLQSGIFKRCKIYHPTPKLLEHLNNKCSEFHFCYTITPFETIDSIEPHDLLLFTQETLSTQIILDLITQFETLKSKFLTFQCGVFICSEYPLIFLKLYKQVDILILKRLHPQIINNLRREFQNDRSKYGILNTIISQYYNGSGFKFKEKESVILSDNKNSHLIIHGLWKNI